MIPREMPVSTRLLWVGMIISLFVNSLLTINLMKYHVIVDKSISLMEEAAEVVHDCNARFSK